MLLITVSATQGRHSAYRIIPGIFFGELCAMVLSFAGIGVLLSSIPTVYNIVKILGVIYILYLGIKNIILLKNNDNNGIKNNVITNFGNGFLMTFLNPKVIIFFALFMPQFIDESSSFIKQVFFLGIIYLIIGRIIDFLYCFFASKISIKLGEKSAEKIGVIGGITMILSAIIILFK
jgi:threonine/homoserine/homoserine lactone efflux protein